METLPFARDFKLHKSTILVWFDLISFFNSISTLAGYLMPNQPYKRIAVVSFNPQVECCVLVSEHL